MSNQPESTPQDEANCPPRSKPRSPAYTESFPQDADLLIVFHGLFSFCHRTSRAERNRCEVGIFNQANNHEFCINIQRAGASRPNSFKYTAEQLRYIDTQHPKSKFRISITGQEANAAFYEPTTDFTRNDLTDDPSDYRWLVDIESLDLYNKQVRHEGRFYRPKILIKQGTFFTGEKTKSTFQFVSEGCLPIGLGSIAFCTAAWIKIPDQTSVSQQRIEFKFRDPRGQKKKFTFTKKPSGGEPNKIFITNVGSHSGSSPQSQSDYYHHFETFTPPAHTDLPVHPVSYKLQVVASYDQDHTCGRSSDLYALSTDPAPCHAMGYGRSGGGT